MTLRVLVLGHTAVATPTGQLLDLGARRHAELLALLALDRGHPVPAEVLADRLWRGSPPPSAATTLQGYVARLRRVLEPGRAPGQAGAVLLTVGGGYQLGDVGLDAHLFAEAVQRVQDLLPDQPAAAAAVVGEALALWRGPPFLEVRDIDAAAPEVGRLEELRATAQELQGRAGLATGHDAVLVPGLRQLVAEHPLRERPAAMLATALYRGGRQGDALAVLRDLRGRLDDELGVDPSAEVQDLEQRILRQDPSLRPPPAVLSPQVPAPALRLAGRDPELTVMGQAWARARGGAVTTVLVRGEAGIGKTRLVEELVGTVVRADGGSARWGRCSAVTGAPPFWPWSQVLGGLPPVAREAEGARFSLGLEVAQRLRALAEEAPSVVVLDDVHWSDADSLYVLDVALGVLQDVPLLLVLTARDDPPRAGDQLRPLLAALARRPGHRSLRLGGLDAGSVAQIMTAASGGPPTPGAVNRVARRTGGNPSFVGELAALGDADALPETVRDVVRLRVDQLPDGGEDLLGVLALAGRDLGVQTVADATGRTLRDLEDALAACVRSGLVVEPAPGRLRVGHDIVREAVVAQLVPSRRTGMHAALADALGTTTADLGGAGAVAEHRLAAAAGTSDAAAARACLLAAREALARAALGEAADWAHRGLGAAEEPALRADLLRVAGTAARRAGRLEEAQRSLASEADIRRAAADWHGLAEAALEASPGGVGGYWSLLGLPLLGEVSLLTEALSHSSELEPALRARVLASAAAHRAGRGGEDAPALAQRAVDEGGGDRETSVRALVAMFLVTWEPCTAPDRLRLVEELLSLAAGDVAAEATSLHLMRSVLLELGRLEESAAAAKRFTAVVQRRPDPELEMLDNWWQVALHQMRGEHDAALRLATSTAESAQRLSPAAALLARHSLTTAQGIAAWHAGRLIDVVPAAAELAADLDADWVLIQALGHAEAGDATAAVPAVDRVLAAGLHGPRGVSRTVLLAEALVALGDAERLEALVPLLRRHGDGVVVLWPGLTVLGPAQLYLGSALAVVGQHREAAGYLESARRLAERLGAAPYARRAQMRLAALPR